MRTARFVFFVRPGHGVVLAVEFEGPVAHPGVVAMYVRKSPNVDGPKIHGLLPVDDPLGKGFARAAAGGDAKRVESGADEEVADLG